MLVQQVNRDKAKKKNTERIREEEILNNRK